LYIIALANDKLVSVSYLKILQPLGAGIVQEIFVREGQKALVGETLMRMNMHEYAWMHLSVVPT
jgi:multidrug efflux pump subunit AcrA (membrane-fusion protein)